MDYQRPVTIYTDPTNPLTRQAQEDEQLFQCLMASINKDAKEVVALRVQYTVNGVFRHSSLQDHHHRSSSRYKSTTTLM
jgi:hypothetical protein